MKEQVQHECTRNGTANIDDLPNELLDSVIEYAVLEGCSINALRLINKRFKACSQPDYIKRVERKKWDLRSPDDIRSLQEMSGFEMFTEALTLLRFTCIYELYHDRLEALRDEAYKAYNYSNTEKNIVNKTDRVSGERSQPRDERSGKEEIMSLCRKEEKIEVMSLGQESMWVERGAFSRGAFPRWFAMRREIETLYGNIWTFPLWRQKLYGKHYDEVSEYVLAKECFITSLANTLERFKKLQDVDFTEPAADGAHRYQIIFGPAKRRGRSADEAKAAYRGLMIGLDLLLRALQRAGIYPESLAVPTPDLNFHAFATFASPDVIRHVASKTHALSITQVDMRYLSPFLDTSEGYRGIMRVERLPDHEQVDLTVANFPNLKDLSLNIMLDSDSINLNKDAGNLAKLDRLTVKYYHTSPNTHLLPGSAAPILRRPECLDHFRSHLKHLVIDNAYHGNWNNFLRHLAKMALETLEIVVEEELFFDIVRESNDPNHIGLICVPETFRDAAELATVRPEWVFDRLRAVWRGQDEAVGRLLEDSDEVDLEDWDPEESE